MAPNITATVKESLPVVAAKTPLMELEEKYAALHRQLEASFAEKEKKMIAAMNAKHLAECSRIQKQSLEDEKILLAELEAKYSSLYEQLEVSFIAKEEKLLKDMRSAHADERRQIAEAAVEREQGLQTRLAAAQRRLWIVIIAAIVSVVLVWNFKDAIKSLSYPVAAKAHVPAPASMPVSAAAAVVETAPVIVLPVAQEAAKKGNGGNFVGGRSTPVKK